MSRVQSHQFLSPTLTRFPWQHNKQLWPQKIPDSKWLIRVTVTIWWLLIYLSASISLFLNLPFLFLFFFLFSLLAVVFWWRSDLQPSLDRVRSASTTCLRPEPNFHFLDRDRYELLLLKWTILQERVSLPRCSTCSLC